MLIFQKIFQNLDNEIASSLSTLLIKHSSESKNDDLPARKIKDGSERISIPGEDFETLAEFKSKLI